MYFSKQFTGTATVDLKIATKPSKSSVNNVISWRRAGNYMYM